jgi:predicted homoserine dehydrogenase-like protein
MKVVLFCGGSPQGFPMEETVVASAMGSHASRRGMYCPACQEVWKMADRLLANQMVDTGLVDFTLYATVAPIAGPVCKVVTVAKRDLKVGLCLDGIGGFCMYGLIDNGPHLAPSRP